jgi:oligopeptide/dipeptide ABC transporter ATP-binding protein
MTTLLPHADGRSDDTGTTELALDLSGVSKLFPVRTSLLRRVVGQIRAVDDVDLTVVAGETVGLVGESGSGKSTLGRLALRLIEPTDGRVVLAGTEISALPPGKLRAQRRSGQMIFQDPYASLDPRATVADNVGEPLQTHFRLPRVEREARVGDLLEQVSLKRDHVHRFPHEFSGGQLQRIALARALAVRPRLIVADEPVSSLDVSTQAQILKLLGEVQDQFGVAYLFISHDLSVVRHISSRIAVMYLGQIVEIGDNDQVATNPAHPYTAALLSAVPIPAPRVQRSRKRIILRGDLPSGANIPGGCRFHTRCPYAMDICREIVPEPYTTPEGTTVRCHLHHHGSTLQGRSVRELPIPKDARPIEI